MVSSEFLTKRCALVFNLPHLTNNFLMKNLFSVFGLIIFVSLAAHCPSYAAAGGNGNGNHGKGKGNGKPTSTPIDGGASLLLAGCASYAANRLRKKNAKIALK
jgi:hypothetical protein